VTDCFSYCDHVCEEMDSKAWAHVADHWVLNDRPISAHYARKISEYMRLYEQLHNSDTKGDEL
jgi:hypothetical protein